MSSIFFAALTWFVEYSVNPPLRLRLRLTLLLLLAPLPAPATWARALNWLAVKTLLLPEWAWSSAAAGSAAVAASATASAAAACSSLLLVLHFVALFDLPFATAFFRSVRTSFVLLNITFNIFANNCCQGQSWITKDCSTLWEYAKASPLTLSTALPHEILHANRIVGPQLFWSTSKFACLRCGLARSSAFAFHTSTYSKFLQALENSLCMRFCTFDFTHCLLLSVGQNDGNYRMLPVTSHDFKLCKVKRNPGKDLHLRGDL